MATILSIRYLHRYYFGQQRITDFLAAVAACWEASIAPPYRPTEHSLKRVTFHGIMKNLLDTWEL